MPQWGKGAGHIGPIVRLAPVNHEGVVEHRIIRFSEWPAGYLFWQVAWHTSLGEEVHGDARSFAHGILSALDALAPASPMRDARLPRTDDEAVL